MDESKPEHFQKKCEAVFLPEMRQNQEIEGFRDSERSGNPLTGFGLLGLHRLVAGRGDGLVPELYDALMREALWREDHPNVVKFPAWAARQPGGKAEMPAEGKVLAFALPVVEKQDERQVR